jgi:hypothetical protein
MTTYIKKKKKKERKKKKNIARCGEKTLSEETNQNKTTDSPQKRKKSFSNKQLNDVTQGTRKARKNKIQN